jgi:hypothetical protein
MYLLTKNEVQLLLLDKLIRPLSPLVNYFGISIELRWNVYELIIYNITRLPITKEGIIS